MKNLFCFKSRIAFVLLLGFLLNIAPPAYAADDSLESIYFSQYQIYGNARPNHKDKKVFTVIITYNPAMSIMAPAGNKTRRSVKAGHFTNCRRLSGENKLELAKIATQYNVLATQIEMYKIAGGNINQQVAQMGMTTKEFEQYLDGIKIMSQWVNDGYNNPFFYCGF